MRRWKRDAKTKITIVLESLQSKPVARIFQYYQISKAHDWDRKKIVGLYARLQAKSAQWLLVLKAAMQRQYSHGAQN